MLKLQIQTFLVSCLLMVGSQGSNYDGYLASMLTRNQEAHDLFRQYHPSGGYVLDYLASPDFLQSHQLMDETEANSGIDNHWSRLLESLAFAEEAAKEPSSLKGIEDRFRSRAIWTQNSSTKATPEGDKRGASAVIRSVEVAPQNDLWGEHRVSGGSSEVGKWMEYAISSAHAQDDDGDDDEDFNEIQSEHMTPNHNSGSTSQTEKNKESSGVKLDSLPAYCDPPNPCPIGYGPELLPSPCDRDIPNTKNFNRAWIIEKMRNGECSCDEEHMESCPSLAYPSSAKAASSRMSLVKNEDEFVDEIDMEENPFLHGQKRGSLVAKKLHQTSKRGGMQENMQPISRFNPYFHGKQLRNVVKKTGHRLDEQSFI